MTDLIDPDFYAWVTQERGAIGFTTKGDVPGHEFHGNQYDAGGGSSGGSNSSGELDTSGIKGSSPQALRKRAEVFNKAFERSSLAKERGAKAEILSDGRLEYSAKKGSGDSSYRIKLNYREALNMLDGRDMRAIHGALK